MGKEKMEIEDLFSGRTGVTSLEKGGNGDSQGTQQEI